MAVDNADENTGAHFFVFKSAHTPYQTVVLAKSTVMKTDYSVPP